MRVERCRVERCEGRTGRRPRLPHHIRHLAPRPLAHPVHRRNPEEVERAGEEVVDFSPQLVPWDLPVHARDIEAFSLVRAACGVRRMRRSELTAVGAGARIRPPSHGFASWREASRRRRVHPPLRDARGRETRGRCKGGPDDGGASTPGGPRGPPRGAAA